MIKARQTIINERSRVAKEWDANGGSTKTAAID